MSGSVAIEATVWNPVSDAMSRTSPPSREDRMTDDGATGRQTRSVAVSTSDGGGIALSAAGYKVRGRWHADLSWTGATSTNVDVYRSGARIATTANDGAYTDATTSVGGGSLTYANTLPTPKSDFFQARSWKHLDDWERDLMTLPAVTPPQP